MRDLFDREEHALGRAREFLVEKNAHMDEDVREEFTFLIEEYAQILNQLRWVTKISDLTALGLNTDKRALLNKVNIDALTEIYNRRFLMTNLDSFLRELQVSGEWLTIMMLDVDFFKNYNDTYGHTAGDACLRKIANAIRGSLTGAEDFAVRYGGEEFIAVLPGTDKERGIDVANRILDNIRDLKIPHETSLIEDCITISIGIVSTIPKAGGNIQGYIDRVDTALYESKKSGRNRLTFLEFEEDAL